MNKLLLIALVVSNILAFGWMTALQIQIAEKKTEFDIMPSQLSKNRNLQEKQYSNQDIKKQLDEVMKKNKQLEEIIQGLKNSISNLTNQLKTKFNTLDMNQKNENQKQDLMNKQIRSTIDGIKPVIDKIKKHTIAIAKNIPKTDFYGPFFYPDQWKWIIYPTDQQILQHPLSTKLTLKKKSLFTFVVNGQLFTSGQQVQVLFFKDNKPIVEKNKDDKRFFEYSYFTMENEWVSLSFVQEVVIEPGQYMFEVGILCAECSTKLVVFAGLSYSIKVEELTDRITVTY